MLYFIVYLRIYSGPGQRQARLIYRIFLALQFNLCFSITAVWFIGDAGGFNSRRPPAPEPMRSYTRNRNWDCVSLCDRPGCGLAIPPGQENHEVAYIWICDGAV